MSGGVFLNIKATKELLGLLDGYRFAHGKQSRAEAAVELLDRALKAFFALPQPVRPGDPDYVLVRSRRRQAAQAFPVREIEARLAQLKKAKAG